jgi:hypothetical protein
MPWCEPCAKYFAPSSLSTEGECPECKNPVAQASASGKMTVDTLDLRKLAGQSGEKVPWHFKLLVSLLCLYLTWRVIQLFS